MQILKTLLILLSSLFVLNSIQGQCSCTDCPVNTISNNTVFSNLNITGATNGTLGSNGQQLTEVCINYDTDAVDEVFMVLTAPNGSSISLMLQTGISVNSGLQFEICFVECACDAMPDNGFSDVFDSGENWVGGPVYSGSYYPADGNCFQSLSGPVNGNWELSVQDVIGLDDGVINDWSLSFSDNSGTGCTPESSCVTTICEADAGMITQSDISLCQGDPGLNLSINPTYPSGEEPDIALFDYLYVISDATNSVILEYSTDADFTSTAPGLYNICGLSYLISDFPLIPTPNGSYNTVDLQNDIEANLFCADLMVVCFEMEILSLPESPIVTGPLVVCSGELVTYVIENFDPLLSYQVQVNSGGFNSFNVTDDLIEVNWSSGPGNFCVIATNICGSSTTCLTVEVLDEFGDVEILGDLNVCPEAIEDYILSPPLEAGESWIFDVTDGTVIGSTDNTVTIFWFDSGSSQGEICVQKSAGSCLSGSSCIFIQINQYDPPTSFNFTDPLCLQDESIAFIETDPNITGYNWILTNLTQVTNNGSNGITFIADIAGTAEICLEVTTECGTFEVACETIEVNEPPLIIANAPSDICSNEFTLAVETEIGAAVNWSQISGPGSVIVSPNQNSTAVIASGIGTYEFQVTANVAGCISSEIIIVVIEENPSIDEISGDLDPCAGDLASYTISPGLALNEFWSFSITGGTVISSDDNGVIIQWDSDIDLGIIEVIKSNGDCDSEVFELFINFEGFQSTSEIVVDAEICLTGITVAQFAEDPSILEYLWSFTNLTPISTNGTNEISFSPLGQGLATVCLDVVTSCDTFAIDCKSVIVSEGPIISELDLVCTGTTYEVIGIISGGTAPYSSSQVGISGNTFTSNMFQSGATFEITISDNNGCETLIQGSQDCACVTDAGILANEILEACAQSGSFVTAEYLGGEILEVDDTTMYILHDGTSISIGNIIDQNAIGIFSWNSNLLSNTIYYITKVAGNDINGQVDLEDNCFSQSNAQAVIFIPTPTLDIDSITTICGFTYMIDSIQFSNTDLVSWTLLSGSVTDFFASSDGLNLEFDFSAPGTYALELNLSNSSCDTSIIIELNVGELTSTILSTECTLDQTSYQIEIQLDGSEPFSTDFPGIFLGNIFLAEDLLVDSIYTIEFTDAVGCTSTLLTTPVLCDCDREIGTTLTDTILLCASEKLDPWTITNQDYVINESTDTIAFALYNMEDDAIENFLVLSLGDSIEFSAPLVVGETYYLKFILSSFDSELNFNDPCLLLSNAVPVIWQASYDFFFDIHPTVCATDQSYTFEQNFPGPFPYTALFRSGELDEYTLLIDQETMTVNLPVTGITSAWEIVLVEPSCEFTFTGNLTITVVNPLEIDIIEFDTICNSSAAGSSIVLSDLLADAILGDWIFEGNIISEPILDFDGFTEGNYSLIFSTLNYELPCPGSEVEFTFYVKDCACPVVSTSENLEVCNADDNIDVSALFTSSLGGSYTLININNTANPPILTDNDLNIQNADMGTYLILFSLPGDFPSNCQTEFQVLIDIEEQLSAGTTALDPQFCEGADDIFNLTDNILNNDQGNFYFNNELVLSEVEVSSLSIGENVFTFITEPGDLCPQESIDLTITVVENPTAEILSEDVLCFGDENGILEVTITSTENGPFICFLDDQISDEKFIEGLAPGNYTLTVINALGCSTMYEDIIINEPEILQVDLGNDKEAQFNDEITIEAIVNILESDITDVEWVDLTGILDVDQLTLIQNAIINNTITIIITDENGCITEDAINIRLVSKDIQLANIISLSSDDPINRAFGVPAINSITKVHEFSIYNRWGELVHQVKDFTPGEESTFWDGTFKGESVNPGVFGYYVEYEDFSSQVIQIIGDVTVVR